MEPSSDPTAPGASKTSIADPERRRSARVASRVNTQDTIELREENTQPTTPISQPTKRPKIILNTNPTKSTGQGPPNQGAENKKANMADEPPRKNRRKRDGTSSRHTRVQAGPSEVLSSEASARSLAGGGYSPEVAKPAVGHGDRSGYSASPGVAGPSSGQQFTLPRRYNTDEIAQSSATGQGHRVPGMPPTIPRSDTPPPSFDTANPYSAFSEQPAIPQRRPSTSTGRSTIPASLPSLPSDQALTGALEDSIQSQANGAQGKLDYRDPNWRHPWGVPVEPLPPTPQPYVHVDPQERALMAAQSMNADQANNQGEVYYGLDEHIPLGEHPLDVEFSQFLFNHNAQENDSANYGDNLGGISHDLREFDNFFSNSPPVSNPQPTTSSTQSVASSVRRPASGVQPASPRVQSVASSVQPAAPSVRSVASDAQLAVQSTQSAASGMQCGNRAGDTNAFPDYPFGYDLPNANPPITNKVVKKAQVGNAFMLLNNQSDALASQGGDSEDVRRTSLAASIMGSLMSEKDKAEKAKAKGKGPAYQPAQHNYQSQPDFQKLALGKIKLAKVSPVGRPTCTFCLFACDWGISDDRYRLSEAASTGSCHECSNPNTGSFFEEFTTILKSRTDQASKDALEKALSEPVHAEPVAHHGEKVYSAIDGTEITKFMGPMFCKTSPYGQLDVDKIRMCEVHKNERFDIIKHHRHKEFRQIGYAMPEDVLSADKVRCMNMNDAEDRIREDVANQTKIGAIYKENRRCMICTGYATDVCADCPLRLCSACMTFLKNICKGYLDNLFYHYERHHLRNDAFLLRSDGGGF